MDEEDRRNLQARLTEANRALTSLATVDHRKRDAVEPAILQECVEAYSRLSHCQSSIGLPLPEFASVQAVLDRLRAHLKYFGEEV